VGYHAERGPKGIWGSASWGEGARAGVRGEGWVGVAGLVYGTARGCAACEAAAVRRRQGARLPGEERAEGSRWRVHACVLGVSRATRGGGRQAYADWATKAGGTWGSIITPATDQSGAA
jgi:hypothetical protein